MIEQLETMGLLLLVGLALFGLLLGIRYALDFVPMSRFRREAVARAAPTVGALCGLFYALFAARTVFAPYPQYIPLVLTLIIVGFIAVSWFALRDFVGGVALKAGRVCQVGDHVEVCGVQGRIVRMGFRVLTIETSEGDEAIIPYSSVAKASLLRTPVLDNVALHVFKVPLPEGMSVIHAKTEIRETALLMHWSSLVREPRIRLVGKELEVTVFSLGADLGLHIERAVREALQKRPVLKH